MSGINPVVPQPGQPAPDFSAFLDNGEEFALSSFRGLKVALFFYPQDNTPTCTVQACNLRDNYASLQKAGYRVFGISPDSVRRHGHFRSKYGLPFPLIADPDHAVAQAYGVFRPKKFMGRTFVGIHRTTFLIGPDGMIERVIEAVKAGIHAEQILGG